MGTVVVVFLQIDLPVMVQVLQCSDLLGLCLGGKIIHYLMEFLDFSLGFPTLHRCMDNPDGKPGKGEFQLLCSILGSIVEIAPVKTSELQDCFAEGVLHNGFFLVIVEFGCQDHA